MQGTFSRNDIELYELYLNYVLYYDKIVFINLLFASKLIAV